jgi:hypothetical protein
MNEGPLCFYPDAGESVAGIHGLFDQRRSVEGPMGRQPECSASPYRNQPLPR